LQVAGFIVGRKFFSRRQMEDAAAHLLRNSARYPLLKPAQEVLLGRAIRAWQDWPDGPDLAPQRIKTAGRRALDRFVMSNIRLAIKVARRYEGRGVDLDDLIQSALEGLTQACKRFKPELGYRSSGYTVWWLRLYCKMALAQQGRVIQLPQQMLDLLAKLEQAKAAFQLQHGRAASEAELAAALEMAPDKLRRTLSLVASARVISLDQVLGPGGDPSTEHLAALGVNDPEPGPDVWSTRAALRETIAGIGDLQVRAVMEMLHLVDDPPKVPRLAKLLNIRAADVRRLEAEGIAIIKAPVAGGMPELQDALAAA
jgi:RNA polymerase sigma factor (sigma-70 family)